MSLLDSWKLDMAAHRMSPQTIDCIYPGSAVLPGMVRRRRIVISPAGPPHPSAVGFPPAGPGAEAATARIRQQAAEAGRQGGVVQRLSDDELRRRSRHARKGLRNRRNEACLRLLAETVRAGELLGLNVPDVDLGCGLAAIRRGRRVLAGTSRLGR